MKLLTISKVATSAAILLAVFALLTLAIPEPPLIDILNGVFLGVLVAAIITYAPLFWHSIKNGRFDRVSQLALGIGLVLGSIGMFRGWSAYTRFHGNPEHLLNHPFISFALFVAIAGVTLMVTAPGYPAIDSQTHTKLGGSNRLLLVCLAIAGGVVTFILSTQGFSF